jgi:hypothetical protein
VLEAHPPQLKTGICSSVRPKRRYFIAQFCWCKAAGAKQIARMGKLLAALFLFGLAAWLGLGGWTRLRAEVEDRRLSGAERVAKARALRGPAIRQRFAEAQLPYPPREIFLRAFKREAELELWARKGAEPFRLVTVFPVLASSGKPGPKAAAR